VSICAVTREIYWCLIESQVNAEQSITAALKEHHQDTDFSPDEDDHERGEIDEAGGEDEISMGTFVELVRELTKGNSII
jgi:hypothetical protein